MQQCAVGEKYIPEDRVCLSNPLDLWGPALQAVAED